MACSITGCGRSVEAKTLCKMHYTRAWKGKEIGPAEPYNHHHKMSSHPLYHIWEAMRQRCNDKNAANYHNYGGRGIKVCKRWDNFRNFVEDMGERPTYTTLDRINVDGDYEPNNCRWATATEQQSNRRNNITITYRGRTQTMMQWSRELNIPKTTLSGRLAKGYPVEAVLSTTRFPGKRTYV